MPLCSAVRIALLYNDAHCITLSILPCAKLHSAIQCTQCTVHQCRTVGAAVDSTVWRQQSPREGAAFSARIGGKLLMLRRILAIPRSRSSCFRNVLNTLKTTSCFGIKFWVEFIFLLNLCFGVCLNLWPKSSLV